MKEAPQNYWADIGGGMIICCKCGRAQERAYIKKFCPSCGSPNRCINSK